jgi:hypothetical protein
MPQRFHESSPVTCRIACSDCVGDRGVEYRSSCRRDIFWPEPDLITHSPLASPPRSASANALCGYSTHEPRLPAARRHIASNRDLEWSDCDRGVLSTTRGKPRPHPCDRLPAGVKVIDVSDDLQRTLRRPCDPAACASRIARERPRRVAPGPHRPDPQPPPSPSYRGEPRPFWLRARGSGSSMNRSASMTI